MRSLISSLSLAQARNVRFTKLISAHINSRNTCRRLTTDAVPRDAEEKSSPVPATGSPALESQKFTRSRPRWISTLDQHRLGPADCLDLSHRRMTSIRDRRLNVCGSIYYHYYGPGHGILMPFPPDTFGWLYFHREPGVPLLASTVRFRVVPDGQPSSFSQSKDLLLPNGQPWQLYTARIANASSYKPLRRLLVSDGFVSEEFMDRAERVKHGKGGDSRPFGTSPFVWSLHQHFPVDLDGRHCHLWILNSRGDASRVNLYALFRTKANGITYVPYRGSALLCFERSPLPEHQGTRTLVLRIVEITAPVERNHNVPSSVHFPEPREGELVMMGKGGSRPTRYVPRSWNVDVPRNDSDNTTRKGLRLLFDNEHEEDSMKRPSDS